MMAMGILREIEKIIGGDIVEAVKHQGGDAAARLLVRKKRPVIIKAYDDAIARGLSGQEACLEACEEFAARTL